MGDRVPAQKPPAGKNLGRDGVPPQIRVPQAGDYGVVTLAMFDQSD